MAKQALKIGDRVAYSANFLRSIGCYTGEMPFLRGQIVALLPLSSACILAEVAWDGKPREMSAYDENEPRRINVANLARIGSAAMSAN